MSPPPLRPDRTPLLPQLFPPKDDKLEEFWIDFNLSSECVSFFVDDPQVQSVPLSGNGQQSLLILVLGSRVFCGGPSTC